MKYKIILRSFLFLSIFSCIKKEKFEVIEFDYIKNQIILSVHIGENGPYNMLLDTGVDPSVIDFETAKDLELPIDTLQPGNGEGRGNDKIVVFPTLITNLKINNQNYGTVDALTMDLKKLGEPLGKKLHGILGYSFLKGKIIRINYNDQIVQIFDSDKDLSKSISDKAYITEFINDGDDMIPIIDKFEINGKKFIGSLDTGSSLNIQVYMHYREKFDIALDTTKNSEIIGAQGKKAVFNSSVKDISIDKFRFENESVTISTIKNKQQLRMGNIGNKFLDNFIITFDYLNNKVIMEKN
jgi:hypothetical protein